MPHPNALDEALRQCGEPDYHQVILEPEGTIHVIPNHPSLRTWSDA